MNIWIDIENTPHVPFFKPIIDELVQRGNNVQITCRNCFETVDLLQLYKIQFQCIGKHQGKSPIKKLIGLLIRSLKLYYQFRTQNIDIALSHGSRALLIAATLLKPGKTIQFFDYEGSKCIPFFNKFIHVDRYVFPEAIDMKKLLTSHPYIRNSFRYPGIKEDVYLSQYRPNYQAIKTLRINPDKIIVVLRPPASQAHYHNPESDRLYEKILIFLAGNENAQTILIARTEKQKKIAKDFYKKKSKNLIILENKIRGLDLLWISDAVISGGGTMIREGAGLGIPAYSIFCGSKPDIDSYLEKQNLLKFILNSDDIKKIKLAKRNKSENYIRRNNILPLIIEKGILY